MTRPYQDLIDDSREQITVCRAWAQRCFDEYMEALVKTPGSSTVGRNLYQTRLNILMIGMKMANSWVDYYISSVTNFTRMQMAQERIERLMS